MNVFNQKVGSHLQSMIEISYEYVGWNENEIDTIYIFCSAETSKFFTFFYKINNNIVLRHEVNDFLMKQCNVSSEQQFAADQIGLNDLQEIVLLFKNEKKDIPTQIKVEYHPKINKMQTDFSYETRLTGTDLMEEDLVKEWIQKLSSSNG